MSILHVPLIIIPIISLKGLYAYNTYFEKEIKVKDKYTRLNEGNGSYMMSDSNNNIYRFGKSLWFMKFDNAETWNSLEKEESYKISGYGWRIPLLNIYPNVVKVDRKI